MYENPGESTAYTAQGGHSRCRYLYNSELPPRELWQVRNVTMGDEGLLPPKNLFCALPQEKNYIVVISLKFYCI